MSLIDSIKENAKKELKTIVLPEPEDERVLKATQQVLAEKTAKVVLIGNPQTIQADAAKCGANIEGATIIDPKNYANIEAYVNELVELRKSKGLTQEQLAILINEKSQQTISNWENGTNQPNLQQLRNLSVALKTTIEKLVGSPEENLIIITNEEFEKLKIARDVINEIEKSNPTKRQEIKIKDNHGKIEIK